MIEIRNVTKSYDRIKAVDNVSVTIRENTVFGLIGTNGAGKSTVLRMVAGVLEPEQGEIAVDGLPVFDNMEAKRNIYFIADEPYFFANSNAMDMQKYLSSVYKGFAAEDFYSYLVNFGLDKKRKVNTYSKGMKKQLALICGVCSGTKYLLCDETFDGLDPVMRQGIKSIFASEMERRGLTPVIASHNLRELEDICDHDPKMVTGRLSNNLLVHFYGGKELIGTYVDVLLKECRGFYYIGEMDEAGKAS